MNKDDTQISLFNSTAVRTVSATLEAIGWSGQIGSWKWPGEVQPAAPLSFCSLISWVRVSKGRYRYYRCHRYHRYHTVDTIDTIGTLHYAGLHLGFLLYIS